MHSIELRHPDGYRQICLQAPKYAVKACKALSASTRLNKIFILFNRIYLFKAPPSCGYRWQLGGNMVADWRKQVKIEQNNCYCSIRAANVVYGADATKLPVA